MMEILKASAGSGKTWNLARTYIRILLESPDRYAYRHVLAVTFTNKATAEMKSRILSELHTLGTAPRSSGYYSLFVPSVFSSEDALRRKASTVLIDMLHDYSAFSISTIDRFFQRALKAFSREIGYYSTYQVELDVQSLVGETVDRMLDSLTREDPDTLDWMMEEVMYDLGRGAKNHLDTNLLRLGKLLKSAEYASACGQWGLEEGAYSRGNVRRTVSVCEEVMKSYIADLQMLCRRIKCSISGASLDYEDFPRSWIGSIEGWIGMKEREKLKEPSSTFLRNCLDSSRWFRKADAPRLLPLMEPELGPLLSELADLFGERLRSYRTAALIRSCVHTLGLAGEFTRTFAEIAGEKNIMSIDDSNTILRRIIDGSGTPFVYEKLGVRYENFLLDEFQDTSAVQWANFMPLLKESDDNGRESLVVGDVKQSIYRFRGSDWSLLAKVLPETFPTASKVTLSDNWRSAREVVSFNNDFFAFVSAGSEETIRDIYSDLAQNARSSSSAPGYVRVTWCGDDSSMTEEDIVLGLVGEALERGLRYRDIAVLVRGHEQGSSIAATLVRASVPVISDDSLLVKSSSVVRRIVSMLSYIENPDDAIGSFVARELGMPSAYPDETMTDLCEDILMCMAPDMEGEVLYVQTFMDLVQEWSYRNGNDVRGFLEWWDGQNPKIISPEDADAVTVMTIHKSKGLEFPFVIVPFLEKIGPQVGTDNIHWCHMEDVTGRLGECPEALYPLNVSASGLGNTFFEKELERDRLAAAVDDLNMAYVAFTRARETLEIVSGKPSPKECATIEGGAMPDKPRLYHYLYAYTCHRGSCEFGSPGFVGGESSDEGRSRPFALEYPSYPLGDRLTLSSDAAEYFSPGGVVGIGASMRLWGIACHDILSRVCVAQDLGKSVQLSVDNGDISVEEAASVEEFLSRRIAGRISWFSGGRILNEQSVIDDVDGAVYRPDRVIMSGDRVRVVDFKFGTPSGTYVSQVRKYVQLYRRMGYSDVKGWLWYVMDDELVEV